METTFSTSSGQVKEILERSKSSKSNIRKDRLAIANILKTMYSKSVLDEITYTELHKTLKAQKNDTPCLQQFVRELTDIGYRRVKTVQGQSIVIEKPKVTFERVRYLQKIKKARSLGKNIYYLDARTFDEKTGHVVSCKGVSNDGRFNEMIFYHATSRDGYKNGLFCFETDIYSERLDSRLKWIMHILLPLLEPASVLVINNSSFLGAHTTKQISRYDSKKYMVSWLKNNNVPCTPSMHKAELYELIEKCSIISEDKSVDNIFKTYGHEVLRLPDTITELNPTVLFWQDINNDIGKEFKTMAENNFLLDLKQFIDRRIQSIPKVTWNQYEDSIIALENEYFALDMKMEEILDKILIEDTQSPNDDD